MFVVALLSKVVSLDRRFLDPRRPQEEPSKTDKEEKLIQYQAYLPVVPTQVISYYKVGEIRDAYDDVEARRVFRCWFSFVDCVLHVSRNSS